MRRMSMLPFRVLCLLAIVLYCVGVANANAPNPYIVEMVKKTHKLAEETSKLKEECEKAGMAAQEAARKASTFAAGMEMSLTKLAAKPTEVEEKKKEGDQLIKIAEEAAKKARAVGDKTTESVTATDNNATFACTEVQSDDHENQKSRLGAEFPNMKTICDNAMKTVEDAGQVVRDTISHAHDAEAAAKRVEDAIKKLDAAVAVAKEKEKKQVDSQAQPQTREPTVGEQQDQAEGTKKQQTEEKGKDAQGQRSGRTITVNIRGENLDALFNDGKNKSGMALQDGSSIPALLRVPLLLLLLFSVLGCMTVC